MTARSVNYRTIVTRLVYFTCVVVIFICLVVKIYECVEKYNDRPTYYENYETRNRAKYLPDITVCPGSTIGLQPLVLQAHGIAETKYYIGNSVDPVWRSNQAGVTPRQLFEEAAMTFEELVSEISVMTRGNQTEHWLKSKSKDIPLDPSTVKVTTQVSKEHARCFTLRVAKGEMDIEKILISGPGKMFIFLHNPGAFQEKELRQDRKVVSRPFSRPDIYFVQFKPSYKLEEQINGEDKYKCGMGDYSYDRECIYDKLDALEKSEECTSPWVLSNTSKICSDDEDVKKALASYLEVANLQRSQCMQPCRSMPITITNVGKDDLSTSEEQHKTILQFQPWITISYQKEHYDFLSLLAEVGGYMGLLCGYSILYFVDIIYQRIIKLH